MMFDNRVLRMIFGSKRYEVTGEWRRIHNVEPNDLYSSSYIVRMITSRTVRWEGACSMYGGESRCIPGFDEEIGGKEATWKTQE